MATAISRITLSGTVFYTGTHDNDTIQGWFASADPVDTEWAREYFRLTKEEAITIKKV